MNVGRLSVVSSAYIIASQRRSRLRSLDLPYRYRTAAQEIVGWGNLVVPIVLQEWESVDDGICEHYRTGMIDGRRRRPSGTERGKAP